MVVLRLGRRTMTTIARFFGFLLVLAAVAHTACAHAAAPASGLWDATTVVKDVTVPFRFELSMRGQATSGAFFNGDERGAHAGFAGKATGAAHQHLKAELRATIEKLLSEKQ